MRMLLLLALLTVTPRWLVTVRADNGAVVATYRAIDRPQRDGDSLCFRVERRNARPFGKEHSDARSVCVPARSATVEEIDPPPARPFEKR